MPDGMCLKSPGFASSLHDPAGRLTMRAFCRENLFPYADVDHPIPVDVFRAYGRAFQQRLVPDVEQDHVTALARHRDGYLLQLDSGKSITARNVIIAVGLDAFRQMPPALRHMPEEFVSHSADHRDPRQLAGRRVAVIGGGASAIDLAVLLHEAGAMVELIARKPELDFGNPWLARARTPWRRLREPLSGIGPGWKSQLFTSFPGMFRHLPDAVRLRIARTHLGPSGGWFMKERAAAVPKQLGWRVERATVDGGRVRLLLVDEHDRRQEMITQHVIAATGYFVDVRRLNFLNRDLLLQLDCVGGSPRLSAHFETNLPGLFFAGPAAAASFGPVMRFVAGCEFAARRLGARLGAARSQGAPVAAPRSEVELES
jgi:cation diffusion facilitator CzcD-associated flavoprotein CzcO